MSAIDDKLKPKYSDYLKKFYAASVREDVGQALFYQLTGKDAPLVLDPSLLLSRQEWEPLVCDPPEKKYALLYSL